MYKSFIRPILFKFNPEQAHKIIAVFLRIPLIKNFIAILFNFQNKRLEKEFCGINFKNPVGLAAGFDKDANLLAGMTKVGFGFIEIGTLTPLAQPGNPQPRLFRLPKDEALINRMGFNNKGVDEAILQLKKFKKGNLIIGGNIGKNKVTPLDQAVEDYKICFDKLHPYVDYFVVNVSSPNTPNLRQLQDKKPLSEILTALMELNENFDNKKPILLKIAPDLNENQLDDIIEIVKNTGIAGIVATNTTISREHLTYKSDFIESIGAGGLSGKPLTKRSTEVVRYISEKSNKSIPIMAAGGIHTAKDALEKLEAGASLVQVYSGFIFEGPAIVRKINKGILKEIVN